MKYLKRLIQLITGKKKTKIDLEGQAASDKIKLGLESGKPFMVARIGFVEINCLSATDNSIQKLKKLFHYLRDDILSYDLNKRILQGAKINAGIFPPTKEILQDFTKMMKEDINQLDILGSLSGYEDFYTKHLKNLVLIRCKDIEPYYMDFPWTKALENKTVLVIHPFADSIEKQYLKRELLFKDPNVLPKFNLKTIKSVQSAAGSKSHSFKNWFEALDHMKTRIDNEEFDIAIIGCGAYGFPLAAHVKRCGKQAIHMGGATQILFGIKGKRWENHHVISKLFNEHWVRPNENEVPPESKKVEGGCYW